MSIGMHEIRRGKDSLNHFTEESFHKNERKFTLELFTNNDMKNQMMLMGRNDYEKD